MVLLGWGGVLMSEVPKYSGVRINWPRKATTPNADDRPMSNKYGTDTAVRAAF